MGWWTKMFHKGNNKQTGAKRSGQHYLNAQIGPSRQADNYSQNCHWLSIYNRRCRWDKEAKLLAMLLCAGSVRRDHPSSRLHTGTYKTPASVCLPECNDASQGQGTPGNGHIYPGSGHPVLVNISASVTLFSNGLKDNYHTALPFQEAYQITPS